MRPVRAALVVLLVTGIAVSMPGTSARACSCMTLAEAAEQGELPDLVFTGEVVDAGDSNVTAEWTRPPQPGLALLFEVDEVRLGEIGDTVVIHTPGGDGGGGNCSIGRVEGRHLVASWRNEAGFPIGGLCSVFPMSVAPGPAELTELYGPARPPDPDVAPETLNAGVAPRPDPDDIPGREVYEELEGELDFSETAADEPDMAQESDDSENEERLRWLAAVAVVGVAALAVFLRNRLGSKGAMRYRKK